MLYCFYNQIYKAEHLGTKKSTAKIAKMGIWAVEKIRGAATDALKRVKTSRRHLLFMIWCPTRSPSYPSATRPVKDGFLTGEMVELIHEGVNNIVCTQPFGCLPNHVVGKGVIKELRHRYPQSNVVAIDYDPGASEVNQLNRIKLMLSTAQKNLKKEQNLR